MQPERGLPVENDWLHTANLTLQFSDLPTSSIETVQSYALPMVSDRGNGRSSRLGKQTVM